MMRVTARVKNVFVCGLLCGLVSLCLVFSLSACSTSEAPVPHDPSEVFADREFSDYPAHAEAAPVKEPEEPAEPAAPEPPSLPEINIVEDIRSGLIHGPKGPEYQRYIVLHDTEGESSPDSVISWWDGNGNHVAAHFVIGTDGSIWQCVPLDNIAHHAGYAPDGSNAAFDVALDGRDDLIGTALAGSGYSDYGMNSWSIGIEMVHVGGSGYYPEEQLDALDALIAYIDAYYGFESSITDHKAWAVGNSDTSPEFAEYLANYQQYRTHDGA
ncbi:MAG: N-acetylmuramoyl-L-alanine amidase [Coriobacteriales bacterium]|jgi:hypothetical protein|nr:N-acetylmuramoyl-L-alanine amidase [Coriobacteriales bacterium]